MRGVANGGGRTRFAAASMCAIAAAILVTGCSTDDPGNIWLPVDYDQPKISVEPDGDLVLQVAIASASPSEQTKEVEFAVGYESRLQQKLESAHPEIELTDKCSQKVPGHGQYDDQCTHFIARVRTEDVTLAPGEKWVHSIRISDFGDRDYEACVKGHCRGIIRMTHKNTFKNSPSTVASQEICWERYNPEKVVHALNPTPKLGAKEGGYFQAPRDELCGYYPGLE